MADANTRAAAQKMYNTFCAMLDHRNWHYTREDEDFIVRFKVSGDDIPMAFVIKIDEDRQLIRLLSQLPFKMSQEHLMDGAIATCVATNGLADGSFDYDLEDGTIWFRMTATYRGGSIISESLCAYLVDCSCQTVDAFNDQFLAIDKGMLSLSQFIEHHAS